MDRRTFIRTGSVAGLSLTALSFSPELFATGVNSTDTAAPDDFELNEATIAGLQEKMRTGKYTSAGITKLYLARIDAIDKAGPILNSVIEVNPDALFVAAAMDAERKSGKVRGPLHGIPVLIKDNIESADKMQTTAGALAMEGNIAAKDAFIVKKLRDAGAVLLGKTNLSEWANFRSEKSTSGWSSRGGQTKNPYILDRNPLGSSSGSGAAVAANLCTVAIGTETDGSIVCPSSVNAIVGIKPTVGLLSRSGIIPISHTQDTPGPMARTVTDAAVLLGALAGIDPDDTVTKESEGKGHDDYTRFLVKEALNGKRIGVDKKWKSALNGVNLLFAEARKQMESMGAAFVEVEYLDTVNELGKNEFMVLEYEFKNDLNVYLSNSRSGMRSLKDVIAFNRENASRAMPFFKQDILEGSDARGGLDSPDYLQALNTNLVTTRNLITTLLNENKLDALCGITMGPACCTDLLYGDQYGDAYAGMASAISGFPHITVPCGMVYGLPVGISFFGDAYSEPELLGLAYSYEQATNLRRKPGFLPVLKG
jgi:amidase